MNRAIVNLGDQTIETKALSLQEIAERQTEEAASKEKVERMLLEYQIMLFRNRAISVLMDELIDARSKQPNAPREITEYLSLLKA